MNFLEAVKRSTKTGEYFYYYFEDGSRRGYRIVDEILLNEHSDFPSFDSETLLSKKFTFIDRTLLIKKKMCPCKKNTKRSNRRKRS